jgi:serine/threonine protein kinase
MDAEQVRHWRDADRLFGLWLDQAPAVRAAWLAQQTLAPQTRATLLALIDQHGRDADATPGLDRVDLAAAGSATPRNGLAGRRVGAWQLIEEIGRGGMSVVYRARRVDVDFDQLAAVKLLGLAALGSEGHQRFEQERRLLARLRHPNIAALIDGGFADDGTPFLAMALIEGDTLARHCATRALPWRARVELMRAVCEAVAHAHRNLMVHRDLKPSNIMVTEQGTPILLDFGIAKLLDDSDEATRTGMRALTPGYAAPEQRDGGPITTATDVYALGVVLAELCPQSGDAPRDLRNIIAMATRAEPERRYPDARSLGEDLARLLAQRPVRATPDSLGYRFGALLRRRRGLAIGAASVLIALCLGLGLALWQAQRAAREADEARRQAARAEAARDFLFTMVDAGDRERNATLDPPVSALLARGIQRLRDAPPSDPELHAEMATLLGHLETSFGRHASAAALLDAALASATLADDPRLLLDVRLRQGVLANATGDVATAIERFEQSLALMPQADPARRASLELAALGGWAYALGNAGRLEEARARLRQALEDPAHRDDPVRRADLLLTLSTVTPDPLPRLEALREVESLFAASAPTPANRLTLSAELASTYARLRHAEAALPHAREAARLVDQIHPGDTTRRARIYNNLGSVLSQLNAMGEADAAYATAEAIYRALGDDESPAFAALLHNRGVLLRDLGAAERGLPLIEQALAAARQSFGADDHRSLIALRNLAFARVEAGDDARADAEWIECRALAAPNLPPSQRLDHLLIGAHVAARLGRRDDLEQRLALAQAVLDEPGWTATAVQRIRVTTLRATLHSLQGDATRADAGFAAADALVRETGAAAFTAHWRNALAQAEHLQRTSREEPARRAFAQTLALLAPHAGPTDSALIARLRRASASSR